MQPTDTLLQLDTTVSRPRPASASTDAEIIDFPLRTEDVIELYKRFRHERDNLPSGAWSGPTAPRFKVFDELSFSELFRLNALWHRVERPRPANGTDANAQHARLQERQWDNFYYNWAQPSLQERWVQRYGLVQAGGYLSYRRLFGKHARVGYRDRRREDDYPPCCDHTTLWRRKGQPSRFAEVFVTQPYFYDLDEMVAFAQEQGLWFWISERPAWHFPRGVFFIEWANPASQFASLRVTKEADAWMRTIHAWKGDVLLPGPGTVFAVKHRGTVEGWRNNYDAGSLTRTELDRLIHNEGVTH